MKVFGLKNTSEIKLLMDGLTSRLEVEGEKTTLVYLNIGSYKPFKLKFRKGLKMNSTPLTYRIILCPNSHANGILKAEKVEIRKKNIYLKK